MNDRMKAYHESRDAREAAALRSVVTTLGLDAASPERSLRAVEELRATMRSSLHFAAAMVTLPGESRAACRDRLAQENCLPCGTLSVVPVDWSRLPLEDVPCPCGDPTHWLVKWWDTPVEG